MGIILGYARTSTSKQDIDNQIIALKEAGVLPENIFYDEGVSGLTLAKNRKAFKKVYEMIQNGEVDRLYVFELSRIGRSSAETLQLFIDIELKGVQIISLSPNEAWTKLVDENMKGIRNIFVSMFAWFADIEKKSLSERTKLGQERARKEGKKIGRPESEPDKKEYNKLKATGLKPAQIARVMQIPPSTLYKWVDRWEEEERIKRNQEL
ncbi:Putative resolvase [Methanosarcina horonobensis HB-1 = JCM 15518]|uniref:Putative resolvase n=1 Tax=Methanosarcina horonobensis HB-1 = JCM 15518 TaxID=1434110 RepID=A0A0E3SAB3_9EURY|nr:recombinase family protein [Methanosarcina horonobensis]AKB78629.1 Putative resolvase [Methanosarcina horonobensis HB-1 = JCM 15518]